VIQRIQSVWLFIAAMLNGLLFILPLYSYTAAGFTDPRYEGVRQYIPLFIVAAIATLLPLLAIFFFMERKRQRGLVWLSMLASAGVFLLMLLRISSLKSAEPPASEFSYALPGILVTIAAIIFEILALRGIRKDEKLIKSLDRLR
jgi:drug/metabolite transporter (DMT)-like permease